MDAKTILKRLAADGVNLALCDDGILRASPAALILDEHRELIRSNRDALHDFIVDAHALTAELIDAAMRACDAWGDSEQARDQMRRECLETPLYLRADLTAHFEATYPPKPPKRLEPGP